MSEKPTTLDEAIAAAANLASEWREQAKLAVARGRGRDAEQFNARARELEREFGVQTRVVGIYLVDRLCGGPEEGGWFYDAGERFRDFEPIVCHGNDAAREAHAKCEAYIAEHRMNEGRHEPNSVLCDGWYASWAFAGDAAPDYFPAVRPHYE